MRNLVIFSIISDCTVLCGITLFYAAICNLSIKLMRLSNMLYPIFDFVFGDGIKDIQYIKLPVHFSAL